MRRLTFILLCLALTAHAQSPLSTTPHFLKDSTGHPFFWLGDTAWELFHRLTREEAEEYLETRRQQGFNVIQAVALAEFNGIRQPNRYGDLPLNNEDPTQLLITPGNNPTDDHQYDYWDHVEYIIGLAESKGLYIGLLPTWGDKVTKMWGEGPVIFDAHNAETYAKLIATRFQKFHNILWILGGDRPAVYRNEKEAMDQNDLPIWRAMARGIEEVTGSEAFITYHPSGGGRTTAHLLKESWLDMHAIQSGHGSKTPQIWKWIVGDNLLDPDRPSLDMEPCYEDHPVNPWDGKWSRKDRGYFSAYDVRSRIYRGVFAGGCGVTYGHHHVWQFLDTALYKPINVGDTIIPWRIALRAEASSELKFFKRLMLSRPYFSRIEDDELIVSERGSTYIDRIVATRDKKGSYAMIYLPQNNPVKISLAKIHGVLKNIWWFDPRSGVASAAKAIKGNGTHSFTPPKGGQDWVLVIDDAGAKFAPP